MASSTRSASSAWRARAANSLSIVYDGDNLYPVVQNLHFLNGKPLDRLKDAENVAFDSRLSLFTIDQNVPFQQAVRRFVVSYDIWEQKFKVTIPDPAPRSRENLTAAQAEAWCLDSLAIRASGLAADRPFFLRMEMRTEQRGELSSVLADPGISLVRAAVELGKAGVGVILVDDKAALGGKLVLQTHKFFGSIDACHAGTRGMDIGRILEHDVRNYENVDGRYAYNTDAKGLSLGLAQWNDRGSLDISAKIWRHTGEKWSRQSEELPLHRVLDLAILVCAVR